MKQLLISASLLGLIAAYGCGSSSDSEATSKLQPGSGVAMNPSGKPQNQEQAAQASQMQQAGNQMNAAREKAAAAEAAARHTGGK